MAHSLQRTFGMASEPSLGEYWCRSSYSAAATRRLRIALRTSWNLDLLGLELLDLKGMGVDLDLTGFDFDEIDELLARTSGSTGLTDPDAVPEVPETPVSRTDDVWKALRETAVFQSDNWDDLRPHMWNFFQAVKTRGTVTEDAVFGNHAAIACHMANESYFRKAPVYWDSASHNVRA
jgi:hypothetical protein